MPQELIVKMAVPRPELILKPSDIDIFSIECASCHARVFLSRKAMAPNEASEKKRQTIPSECLSCGDKWENIKNAVQTCFDTLKDLEAYSVAFHVPTPISTGGGTPQPVGVIPPVEGGD